MTWAQAVTLMYRYAQIASIATDTGAENFDNIANKGTMSPCYNDIGWAEANGLLNGNGAAENAFGPMGAACTGSSRMPPRKRWLYLRAERCLPKL